MKNPSPHRRRQGLVAALLAAACIVPALASLGANDAGDLPPILFAQRMRVPGVAIPLGVGPAGRTMAAGGRLVVRERDGRFIPLHPDGAFYDVQQPDVSYDGRQIVFAAITHRDSAWRIWKCSASGREITQVTFTDRDVDPAKIYGAEGAKKLQRYDDLSPCWLPDGRIVFSSTRYPLLSQAGVPATNLWVVAPDGKGPRRITAERDGAESPSVDPITGRLLYSRWFFNRWRAADNPAGLVNGFEGAIPADTVNLWHAGSIGFDGDHLRLAGGDPRFRLGQMASQPIVTVDTSFVAVVAERSDLVRSTRLGVVAYPKRFGPPRPLAGMGTLNGWSAFCPAELPNKRVLFSMDWAGTGNFDLFMCRTDGIGPSVQLTQDFESSEIDAVVLAPRPKPPHPLYGPGWPDAPDAMPATSLEKILADERTSRFDCLNVFANAPVDAPFNSAPGIRRGVKIRFYTTLPRPPSAGGDSLVLLREAPVNPQGAVHVDAAPADVPMFEQLVDSEGLVLLSAHGTAHVPGYNYTRPGAGTKCVGCHAGHSAITVPATEEQAEWTNVSPGAKVSASSELRGMAGAPAVVDRRTLGDPTEVAWISDGETDEWVRLDFPETIEGRAAVLYGMRGKTQDGGPLVVKKCELVLLDGEREVKRVPVAKVLSPDGTRVELGGAKFNALVFRPLVMQGKFRKRALAALAEIETIARISVE